MRQLAALPNADAARTLADRLQTLHIETRLESLPDGCAVWVLDEDRLPRAKEELAEFTRNPSDPRFADARTAAEAARRRQRQEEAAEAAAESGRPRPVAPPGPLPAPGPWTYGLILTCLLVFAADATWVYFQYLPNGPLDALTHALHLTSDADQAPPGPVEEALAFSTFEMVNRDAVRPWPRQILAGQVWRLVTPIFLHFGPFHLLFNLFFLYQLGGMIEERRGAVRFLLLVLGCAVLSNCAQYGLSAFLWRDGGLVARMPPLFGGMSGVLYGLFGYVWMKSRYEPALGLWLGPRTVFWLLAWLVICMTGMVGPVANIAHIAGLLFGVAVGVTPHLWRLARGTRPT